MDVIPSHIVRTSGVCRGEPVIAGTRQRVADIAGWHLDAGMSVDELADGFPQLTRADIHAALAYYYDHRTNIEADGAEAVQAERQYRESQAAANQRTH